LSTIFINPPFIYNIIHYFSNLLNPEKNNQKEHHDLTVPVVSSGLHILLADDDDDDRYFFAQAVNELSGCIKLSTAKDGTELLRLLKNTDVELPDLIFLDLNMPRKNGLECLEELRQSAQLKNIPVIIYSTSSHPRQVEDTYKKGANLFIQKPDSYTGIKKVLHKVLSISRDELCQQADRASFLIQ